jgi:hypothetical protein
MSLTVAEVKDLLEISSTGHDTAIAALLPLVTAQINEYCGGAFSHQVKEEEVTFTVIGSSGYQSLDYNPVVRGSVYCTSTDRGTVYYGDATRTDLPIPSYLISSTNVEDYRLDYEGGRIYITSTDSQIAATDTMYVTYAYIDLVGGGKIAASRLIQQSYQSPAGIGSESVGSLSRSYTGSGQGMDSYTTALLSAYKRPRLI